MTEPRETGPIWRCPACYFGFHAEHTDEKDGGHSCPLCAEIRMREALEKIWVVSMAEKALGDAVEKDACEQCRGERGGVPGNENIVGGRRICDYCDAERLARSALGNHASRDLNDGETCPACGWTGTHLANCVRNPEAV